MSTTGMTIFAKADGTGVDVNGVPALLVTYRYSTVYRTPTGNEISERQIAIPMLGRTESEINTATQLAVLEACNAETEGSQGFLLTDITGGRI